jgi:hypothetical protein
MPAVGTLTKPRARRRSLTLKVRKQLGAVIVVGSLSVGTLGLTAGTASAAVTYAVNPNTVCSEQYSGATGASFWSWSPYALYCYQAGVSFPWGATITPLGGLDVQAFCSRWYPGSRAVVGPGWRWPPNAWACESYADYPFHW